ncbi:MAG: oligosaccharide flippase family protein [bacterium]
MDSKANTKKNLDNSNHKDAKDLMRGALVNYLGMLAKISKVLFVLVAAHFYGTNAWGLYLLAWSIIDIASKFGLWGMDRSLIRDIARYNVDKSDQTKAKLFGIIRFTISIAFCLSLLVTGVMVIISPLIAERIFKDANLTAPMRILAFALPFVVLTHAFIATTKALRIMRYEALIRHGLEPLILLLGTLLLIPLNLGALGLVTAHIFASFVAASSAAFVAFRKYRYLGWFRQPLSGEIKRETIRYTSPIAAMDFLNLSVARIDIILVGAFLNSTSVGLYGYVVEIVSVIKRVRQGFEPIFAPIVSELFYNGQKERLQSNYVLVTRWLMAGTLLPVVALVLYPNQILLLFKVKSSEAALALIVLTLAHGLFGTFSAAENLLIMTGKTLLNTLLAGFMLAINCAVAIILIPKLGLVGASLGIMTAFAFVSGARLFHGYRLLQFHPFSYSLLWPLVTAGLTLGFFFFLNNLLIVDSLLKTIAVFVLMTLFYTSIYFLGATKSEEKHLISKLKNKLKWKPAIIKI